MVIFLLNLQQEVLRLLVNLSCNADNLEGLLEFKVGINKSSYIQITVIKLG